MELQGGIQSIWLWALLQTLAFAVALPLTIGLLMLLGWHIHLVVANKTTIEYQEVRRPPHPPSGPPSQTSQPTSQLTCLPTIISASCVVAVPRMRAVLRTSGNEHPLMWGPCGGYIRCANAAAAATRPPPRHPLPRPRAAPPPAVPLL